MISLALRGKIALSEDVLTAALFDHLRRTADLSLLRAMLSRSMPPVALPAFDRCEVQLWPRTDAGEPDVRIHLQRGTEIVATCLVEAKLGAGKSGEGEVSEDHASGDC